MQNGTTNGIPRQNERVTPEIEPSPPEPPSNDLPVASATLDPTTSELKEDVAFDHNEGPPSKRRKVGGSTPPSRSVSRAVSPPWKKAGADGPTSRIVDGKRRSTRVSNVGPLDQPSSDTKLARAAQKQYVSKAVSTRVDAVASSPLPSPARLGTNRRATGGTASTNGSPSTAARGTAGRRRRASPSPVPKRSSTRTRSDSSGASTYHHRSSNGVNSYAHANNTRSTRSSLHAVSGANGIEGDIEAGLEDAEHDEKGEHGQRIPRLRIKVKKPALGIQHPAHVLPNRKYGSFKEWVEQEGSDFNPESVFIPPDPSEEAQKRRRVMDAMEPGGLLSSEVCSAFLPEQQEEPPQQFSHQDHLLAHAAYFKKLLDQEHRRHRVAASKLAQACAEAWRKRNKDPEDILREQQEEMRGKRKQLAKDLKKMFDLARAEIDRIRLARWEEEQKAKDQRALDRAIQQSTMLFEKRRLEILGETGSDAPETSEDEADTDDESDDDDDDGESNMSSTESESEDGNVKDDDAGLTAEELRLKYANLPDSKLDPDRAAAYAHVDVDSEYSDATDVDDTPEGAYETPSADQLSAQIDLDEVDPRLLDDSEESTDMDDDMGDSDEESSEPDSEEDDGRTGLLGFFSAKDLAFSDLPHPDTDKDDDNTLLHSVGTDGDENPTSSGDDESEYESEDPDEVTLVPTGPTKKNSSTPTTSAASPVVATPPIHTAPADIEASAAEETALPGDEPSAKKPLTIAGELAPADIQVNDIDMADVPSIEDPNLIELSKESPEEQISEQTERGEPEHQEPFHSRAASSEASPGTVATKPSEPESVSSYEPPAEKHAQISESPGPGLKTPIPHLLRGTLREYQHFGLDWLAGLYTNHINGILADEMGLGKTIQTIALLAHLAVEHEVWGPHLVVVPTSVILNWEMEFKKWCPGFKIMTYYGNQEERRQKRRGWMDDNNWNVLITSYQLVLQDQQVLKRRSWHYMILDEAHNIKNFRSQRWQALLTFRTRARLLLTGTPLQNNLTELWSLLFFLMPTDGGEAGIEGFADLRNFSEWFRRPVEQILEHGRETMDDEAKRVVTKLHTVLRPYILRRLKADVEKQMPGKYEHVVYCRLSKRQRYLYDGFMSRAQTKETLASGNYLSIINCLMQLRKVCNHPDLFETRPISTSFAMTRSVATEFEFKELLVRRRLLYEHPLEKLDFDFLNLVPISREDISRRLADDSARIMAYAPFNTLRERQYHRTNWQMKFNGTTIQSTLEGLENDSRKRRMAELERSLYFESKRHGRRPIFGSSLIEFLTADSKQRPTGNGPLRKRSYADWLSSQSSVLASMIMSLEERSQVMDGYVQRFACVTPAAIAAGVTEAALTPVSTRHLTNKERFPPYDPFHEAQMRLSIAFPDKRLLQYDCGKLQRLDKLLRDLKAGGHRALIFTQMTKMLDVLEQFLNIHGHRYLRLDGTTKVEQRQILTDRFNNDNRILAFILSSRSGGLGINLTGADTVIFYDLDWNPAMDKQCQDRCHRIGQTRDVHIYRFVSEYTIESNILRKANQKRMLDDVVIQEGEFTTDYFTKLDVRDMIGTDEALTSQDEASAAMDRVLENRVTNTSRVFEQAEDKEDIDAAKNAQKELEHADDGDFDDRANAATAASTSGQTPTQPGTPLPDELQPLNTNPPNLNLNPEAALDETVDADLSLGHVDDYLMRFMEWNMKDEPLVLPVDKSTKKSKKGKEHRLRKRRR
ncbi:SNF2 family N-terminal domain-containing protein [Aspergillus karnatakaensis]|uniref:putative SNF2 family helicase/ATPase (Swr1) n=1 Tax=Aspergillus karnatakaensis TaxID=1810916 RepID=UPI003CCD85D5